MQQIVACSEDGFAFGEPDKFVLKKYEYLTPEDCVSLRKVRCGIEHPKYGQRYKLLYESILAAGFELEGCDDEDKIYVALVVISRGPLFVDLRYGHGSEDRAELGPGGFHLQIYVPGTFGNWTYPPPDFRGASTNARLASGDQRPSFWPAIGHADDIPADLSRSGLELAGQWLEECTSLTGRHENCAHSDETPLLPTRVIDVGSDNTDVHLHISRAGERGQWVALSHCWGSVTPIKTTTSTLHEHVNGLPAQMPKTFADAIFVTRALGQRYLWIDSLCILQDSTDDWMAESSAMHQVYSQAILTMVADAATDSTSGFLQPPARQVKKTSTVHYDFENKDPACGGFVHVRQRGELAFQLPYHDFREDGNWRSSEEPIIHSKLSTRGWAFQERLLSPRTLHFGPTEMGWECRALCTCECSAKNERTSLVTGLLKGTIALQPSPALKELSARRALWHLDNAWRYDVVEEYTRLDLTMGTDRLHALAGVAAKALSLRPGDEYIAGMWRNTLARDLLWHTVQEHNSVRLPGKKAAPGWPRPPSWSWASVSGQIRHVRHNDDSLASLSFRVLSVHYKTSIASPMGLGPREPAFLLAWGYVVPIQNIWYQKPGVRLINEDEPYWNDGAKDYGCYRVSWPPGVNLPSDCIAMMDVHRALPPFDEKVVLDRLDDVEPESDLEMLLTSLYAGGGQVYGLILRRCEKSGAVPAYERVGSINGTGVLKRFLQCNSTSCTYVPADPPIWHHEEDMGISPTLGGIGKSMIKIW